VEEDERATRSAGAASADPDDTIEPDPAVSWSERLAEPTFLDLPDAAERSPHPETCPFLRRVDADGRLAAPTEGPNRDNRCVAFGEPKPQSPRQQQLVCLTVGHANCPRYLRGTLLTPDPGPRIRARVGGPSPAVVGSMIAFIVAATFSIAFLIARGGVTLALPSASPDFVAVASFAPSPGATMQITAPPPTPGPTSSPAPTPTPTPTPTASPPPTPTLTPAPVRTATTAPTSNRYQFLEPCPDAPSCWIYTVRVGDNFTSIVNWFGVGYQTVLTMNPQIQDPATIRAGDEIRMPPPTR
jgi:hypothetical protein